MQRWTSGRNYDKPFCRRVLVEAGIPDTLFGVEKKAASVLLFDNRSFLSDASLADFLPYMREIQSNSRVATMLQRCKLGLRQKAATSLISTARYLPGSTARRVSRRMK